MGIMPEILSRYSCKRFSPQLLNDQEVTELLEAARLAPSAKNRQAWRFVAITRADLLQKMSEACYSQEQSATAPCIIACCTTNIDYKMPNGQLSYPVDLGLSSGFIMLQASHLGLTSCALSTFDEELVKKVITMPYLMRVVLLVAVGYPHPEDPQAHRQRLPFNRVCSENHW